MTRSPSLGGSRDCEESFRQISPVGNMGLDPSSSSIHKGMLQSNIGWVSNSPMVNIGAKSAATWEYVTERATTGSEGSSQQVSG